MTYGDGYIDVVTVNDLVGVYTSIEKEYEMYLEYFDPDYDEELSFKEYIDSYDVQRRLDTQMSKEEYYSLFEEDDIVIQYESSVNVNGDEKNITITLKASTTIENNIAVVHISYDKAYINTSTPYLYLGEITRGRDTTSMTINAGIRIIVPEGFDKTVRVETRYYALNEMYFINPIPGKSYPLFCKYSKRWYNIFN